MKWLIQWAVTSSSLILIVLTVRFFLKDRLSARVRYALWGLVLLRLLVPVQVELPAAASDVLPVLASNLALELPSVLERPLSPDTAATHTQIPAEDLNGTGTNGEPVFSFTAADLRIPDYQNGCLHVYQGGFTLGDMAVTLWLAGAGLTGGAILLSNLRFAHRLRKRRRPLERTDAPIPVYVAEGLPSPCLFGVLRPAVYITPKAAENPDTLRHVLAHELTHYAHKDHIWSLLRILALALHWYNPLVWLAVILSKRDGELACDEGAVARLGEAERVPYGRTLVDMVAARSLRPVDLFSCSTAMTGGKKSIQERVARLVKKPETAKTALFAALAVVVLAAVFVFAGRGQPDNIPHSFLGYVERADSIQYSPPLYSSQIYPDPITDEDLLSQAKEALSGFRYLEDDDPQPDLQAGLMHSSRIMLSYQSGGRQYEPVYTLLWQDGRSYLFPEDMWELQRQLEEEEGETAQLLGVSGTCVSEVNVVSAMESLARQQNKRLDQARQEALLGGLTQKQVDRANEAFRSDTLLPDGSSASSEISCFFTSSYDSPARIDLEEFLRYCPLAEEVNEQTEREEYQTVIAASWWVEQASNPDFLLPTPMWRYPREKVSALLERYTGVTIDQLDWGGMLYLEEYDSFYNFTSDYGPGFFTCAGGRAGGDTVILWSAPNGDGDRSELALQKRGDSWLIQSFHTAFPR